jgi:hypothetical protein
MKLKLFGKALSNKAFTWFKTVPLGMKDTSANLSHQFLTRFYPKSNSDGARCNILNFKNRLGESLVEGCTRFRGLLEYKGTRFILLGSLCGMLKLEFAR